MKNTKCKKMAKGGLFAGKESMKEEKAEASALKSGRISKAQYMKGEKAEGESSKGLAKKANMIKSGKMSPSAYAKAEGMKCGGKVKMYAEGGDVMKGRKPPKDVPEDDMPPTDKKGKMLKPRPFAKGGGVERKGKTRGRMI